VSYLFTYLLPDEYSSNELTDNDSPTYAGHEGMMPASKLFRRPRPFPVIGRLDVVEKNHDKNNDFYL